MDFITFDLRKNANQVGHGGDRRSVEYHLTIDMAKQLAMVQNNERGRQARLYFIECDALGDANLRHLDRKRRDLSGIHTPFIRQVDGKVTAMLLRTLCGSDPKMALYRPVRSPSSPSRT
ncbi:antA/AntB antirepressor family protein [Acidithiobacillus ferrooxidans]|uniref:antA/AntB antirepressor family protein n=1 Tax=Acidithiobacillus ferrooxidans TaxID=920 RepID=UPI00214B435D|nr:antA/AntB antirepressor family protein [Acidithiobacillus ferrooxidans]MCR2831326.1 antA/AntB antirepressor family protein [Acidithiobacillus ferrooxidans]